MLDNRLNDYQIRVLCVLAYLVDDDFPSALLRHLEREEHRGGPDHKFEHPLYGLQDRGLVARAPPEGSDGPEGQWSLTSQGRAFCEHQIKPQFEKHYAGS